MISCVVLNYNDSKRSMMTASKLAEYSIVDSVVIVDNHSNDNSYDTMKEICDDKIVVIQSERNGGYGYGNNYGLKYIASNIGSPYVLIINPDVHISERSLSIMQDYLEHNLSCAVVSCRQLLPNGKENISFWDIPSTIHIVISGSLVLSGLFRKRRSLSDSGEAVLTQCVAGSCLLVNRDKILSVGGYDEDFFLYMEENVLGTKLLKAGFTTCSLRCCSYLHDHSASISKIHSIKSRRRMLCDSRMLFLKKYRNTSKAVIVIGRCLYRIGTVEIIIKEKLRSFKKN